MSNYYESANEFKTDLKDYNKWVEHRKQLSSKLEDLKYLRYEKIKSPLDYDVVGYDGNEQIRAIKGHSAPLSTEAKWEQIESLDAEIERTKALINKCNIKLGKIKNALETLPEDVRFYCISIYINKQSYADTAKRAHMSVSSLYRAITSALKCFDLA